MQFSEFEELSSDGLNLLLLNIFNSGQDEIQNEKNGVPLSHPIHIAELFNPNGLTPTNITVNYTLTGLSKLLLFNDFARAQATNVTDVVISEARKYPYPQKYKVADR